MATVTVLDADRMLEIEGKSILSAGFVNGEMILNLHNGEVINVGVVPPVNASRMTGYGHSYLLNAGSVSHNDRVMIARVGQLLHATITNQGISGAVLLQDGVTGVFAGWNKVFQEIAPSKTYATAKAYVPELGAAVLCWGVNDLVGALAADALTIPAYKHALRAVISRMLSSAVFEDNNAAVTKSGTWATVAGTTLNSGGGRARGTGSSPYAEFTVPTSYLAGVISIGFVASRSGDAEPAGVQEFRVNGALRTPKYHVGAFDTDNVWPNSLGLGAMVARLDVSAGDVVRVTNVSGGMSLDYFALEARPQGRPVIVCNAPRLPTYGGTYGDAHINALNVAMSEVVAEFVDDDYPVAIADFDAALNKDARYWNAADQLNPNDQGHAICTAEIVDTFSALAYAMTSEQRAYL